MVDVSLAKDDHLFPVFHLAVLVHIHTVHKNIIVKLLLHLGHVHHAPGRQLLKLLIVDVCPVHGEDLISECTRQSSSHTSHRRFCGSFQQFYHGQAILSADHTLDVRKMCSFANGYVCFVCRLQR